MRGESTAESSDKGLGAMTLQTRDNVEVWMEEGWNGDHLVHPSRQSWSTGVAWLLALFFISLIYFMQEKRLL